MTTHHPFSPFQLCTSYFTRPLIPKPHELDRSREFDQIENVHLPPINFSLSIFGNVSLCLKDVISFNLEIDSCWHKHLLFIGIRCVFFVAEAEARVWRLVKDSHHEHNHQLLLVGFYVTCIHCFTQILGPTRNCWQPNCLCNHLFPLQNLFMFHQCSFENQKRARCRHFTRRFMAIKSIHFSFVVRDLLQTSIKGANSFEQARITLNLAICIQIQ